MTKYDQKRVGQMDDRRRSITAQETAAREAAREKQRQRLREAQEKANKLPKNKYGNRKTERVIRGETVVFDSAKEARRWDDLYLLERAGEISDLKRQVRYRLIPAQRDMHGKVVEKPCDYVADFAYRDKDGRIVVEDVKSEATLRNKDYVIKRKLMLRVFGIRVKEV